MNATEVRKSILLVVSLLGVSTAQSDEPRYGGYTYDELGSYAGSATKEEHEASVRAAQREADEERAQGLARDKLAEANKDERRRQAAEEQLLQGAENARDAAESQLDGTYESKFGLIWVNSYIVPVPLTPEQYAERYGKWERGISHESMLKNPARKKKAADRRTRRGFSGEF